MYEPPAHVRPSHIVGYTFESDFGPDYCDLIWKVAILNIFIETVLEYV